MSEAKKPELGSVYVCAQCSLVLFRQHDDTPYSYFEALQKWGVVESHFMERHAPEQLAGVRQIHDALPTTLGPVINTPDQVQRISGQNPTKQGFKTKWICGECSAGIATQRTPEGYTRHEACMIWKDFIKLHHIGFSHQFPPHLVTLDEQREYTARSEHDLEMLSKKMVRISALPPDVKLEKLDGRIRIIKAPLTQELIALAAKVVEWNKSHDPLTDPIATTMADGKQIAYVFKGLTYAHFVEDPKLRCYSCATGTPRVWDNNQMILRLANVYVGWLRAVFPCQLREPEHKAQEQILLCPNCAPRVLTYAKEMGAPRIGHTRLKS